MDLIRSFLKDVSNGKFKVRYVKFSDEIKQDERFDKVYSWLHDVYVKRGMGIKSIIKDYDLPVGYSFLRHLIIFLGFELHSNCVANSFLKERRAKIAKDHFINKTGFFRDGIQSSVHHNSTKRGIQGYYWNSSKQKYVWLRSSWEFIYAKWLNAQQNIIWDVECQQYNLGITSYRPDFFIYNDENILTSIVEVKGFWKNRLYKVEMLQEKTNLPIIVIDNITPYCSKSLNEEITLWKKIRKLELNN